jgi:uncharacterized protein
MAVTPEQHERGLMYRKSLPEGQGMLFVFSKAQEQRFWMMNTVIPLSIGYFSSEKKLIKILDMFPPSKDQTKLPTYPSGGPAMYALEVPLGWFRRNGIKTEVHKLELD